jgi:uncharacterized SAM-binding protein YcdF (DUF218 family)
MPADGVAMASLDDTPSHPGQSVVGSVSLKRDIAINPSQLIALSFYTAMYFYLSKTLGDFTAPSTLIPLLLVFGLLLWRSRRYSYVGRSLTICGVILVLAGSLLPIGTILLVSLEDRFPRPDLTSGAPTGIVVLGGVVNAYITVKRHDIALDSSAGRLIAAVDLQRRYPQLRVVFSGGNSNLIFKGRPESDLAARFLERLGVPKDQIAVDNASRNTMENAVNAKRIADPKPGERWLLVTSAFHIPRAMGLFRLAGFPIEAYPVDYRTRGTIDAVRPFDVMSIGLRRTDTALHEWFGLLGYRLTGKTSELFPTP